MWPPHLHLDSSLDFYLKFLGMVELANVVLPLDGTDVVATMVHCFCSKWIVFQKFPSNFS